MTKINNHQAHIPGKLERAAAEIYAERGSVGVANNQKLSILAGALGIAVIGQAVAIAAMMPLKSVEIVHVKQDATGRMQVDASAVRYRDANEEAQMSWVIDWAKEFLEINQPTWRRNVTHALRLTGPVAKSQADQYLQAEGNNPAILLGRDPSYFREFDLVSVNMVQPLVVLIRYRITSRTKDGIKEIKNIAMTATLSKAEQTSRAEVVDNPSGLIMNSFSISDETNLKSSK